MENILPEYGKMLFKRDRESIVQHSTPVLKYPTQEELAELVVYNEVWKVGSKFYKLADKYYGNPAFWWIIPWFNLKPLEANYNLGDVIMVPTPLEKIINFLEV